MNEHNHVSIDLNQIVNGHVTQKQIQDIQVIPVVIPYRGFQLKIVVNCKGNPNAGLVVLDLRQSENSRLFRALTDEIFLPEDFDNGLLAATGTNIQKALSWIDRQVKIDAMITYERFRSMSYEEKIMIVGMSDRVRLMLPNLSNHWITNWESFQLNAGCAASAVDKSFSPSKVIEAMSHIEHFQKLWFASENNTSENMIRNWLFVYLLGETQHWRVDSGWVPRTIPLDKSKDLVHVRWTE